MDSKSILIVEDNVITARDIEASLQSLGYQSAGICESGEDAIDRIEDNSPDLILMDIELSGEIDGIQTANYIIERHSIPVIYLTSNNDLETISRTKETHPYGYLVKPASGRHIFIAIEMALGRFELENSLRTHKNLFSHTLESINDGVIVTDTRGSIILINRVAELMTGFTSVEAVGAPVENVFITETANDGTVPENICREVLRTERNIIQRETRRLRMRDGTRLWISESCTPLRDNNNTIIGTVLVFQDITLKKQAEQERLKSKKIESMSLLAAGLAHDFNNLLTGIVGNISMLKLLTPSTDTQLSDLIGEIEKASLRARDLANQIRDFAKGGAPVKKSTDLATLIRDSTRFLLSGSNIDLTIQKEDDLSQAQIDPGQTSQVIENLVMNAKQAIEAANQNSGRISIALYNELQDESSPLDLEPGRYVRITINDNGAGINPDILDKIFDPYFTTKETGAGLGLASSYNNIKRNGGTILVESQPGRGSTFTLFLPAAERSEHPEKIQETIEEGSGHVLVIDDEESIRIMLEKMLEALGYTPHIFSGSGKALEFARSFHERNSILQGAILDLTVPGSANVTDILKDLRRINPSMHIVLMSGYTTDNPYVREYTSYGFDALLKKPFTIENVSSSLRISDD